MKLCILSMQRVQNFGSLLQGYALKVLLEQLGHTVSFLDIEKNEVDDRLLDGKCHHFPEENDGRGILSKIKKLDRYTVNRLRMKGLSRLQNSKFERFRMTELEMKERSADAHYDCCVIGSDEVFNCMSGAPWGLTGQLFGDVKQADKVITYAASCGATKLEELPEAAAQRIRGAFENVSAFSVRDENTRHMVSHLTEKAVMVHFDPVFVGDFEEEMQKAALPRELPRKYCIVYSYYNRISRKEEIRAIKGFCKAHGLEIVTVGAPQMWVKKHLVLEPFAMLRVFQNADFVITDTFHGTLFSAKYAQRFAVMVRPSNENKLADLIGRLELDAHRLTSFDQLETVYGRGNDVGRIAALTEAERNRSLRYLRDSLEIGEKK